MGRTINELMSTMSAPEYGRWMAYYQVEPWGSERWDIQFAVLASVIANASAPKKSGQWTASDFMLFAGTPRKQTGDDMEALMMTMTAQREAAAIGGVPSPS